jgi:transposase
MGRTLKLTESQWDELDRLRITTESADVFRNCTIILMSAAGGSKASISKDLGCCTDTIARVRKLYRQGGVKALYPIQPEVPSPGKNEKQVVYGGVDYRTGRITYTVAATKSGLNFLAFLVALVAAYAGQKIRLVCDNGRFHQTKAVFRWLETHRDQIEIYWLPPYCPSLNLIERLCGHLKRTVLANVLFATMDDLLAAFRRGVARVNGHRNKMNFIFDHDDIKKKVA